MTVSDAQVALRHDFWRGATIAVLVTACCTLTAFLVGALAVQLRAELGIRLSQIGFLVAVFFAVSALVSWAAGSVVERAGSEHSMRISALAASIALMLGGTARGWAWLLASMVVGGIANAVGQVGANLFIARFVHSSRHGFAFGIKQAGVPAATLLGGLAVPSIALTVGWRWAFLLGAVLALSVGIAVPRTSTPVVADRRFGRILRDLPKGPLVVLGIGAALGAGSANALAAFFVDSTVTLGVKPGLAGLLYAGGSAAGLLTRVAIGWAADRRTSSHLLWVAGQLVAGAVGYGMLAAGITELLVPAILLCFAGGWGWPGLFNLAIVVGHPEAPAAATGITQTGVYAGGVLGPVLFGLAAEAISYPMAWSGLAIVAAIGAVAVVGGRRLFVEMTRRKSPGTRIDRP